MNLASAVGLPTARVEIRTVEGLEYLLVKRYDRVHRKAPGGEPVLITGVIRKTSARHRPLFSEMKYQKEGGPSLKQCFDLLREVSSAPVIDLAKTSGRGDIQLSGRQQ